MKSWVYECDVEWLRSVVKGGLEMSSVKSVKSGRNWRILLMLVYKNCESVLGAWGKEAPMQYFACWL